MNGTLPWSCNGINLINDQMYFKNITSYVNDNNNTNAIIMGRKTWEGLPRKNKPLKNRLNVVLTSNKKWAKINLPKGTLSASSLQESLKLLSNTKTNIENVYVIGGSKLFEEVAFHPNCHNFHITKIDNDFECDTFLTDRTKVIINFCYNSNYHHYYQKLFNSLMPISVSDIYEEMGVRYKIYVYNPSSGSIDIEL